MIALLVALTLALAPPDERLDDPALEARAEAITEGLRCLVCEGQGVNDSNAEFARDVRVFVRERIAAGDTDEEIREALRVRFGDVIFQRPPLRPDTALLWFGPLLAAAIAAVALARRKKPAGAAGLSDRERARLEDLERETH
ncbi:MAG: cytochrome c-type biogenesis protein [Pseudomonadota bacterium]